MMKDEMTQMVAKTFVDPKGATPYAVKFAAAFLKNLGYRKVVSIRIHRGIERGSGKRGLHQVSARRVSGGRPPSKMDWRKCNPRSEEADPSVEISLGRKHRTGAIRRRPGPSVVAEADSRPALQVQEGNGRRTPEVR